MKKKDEKEKTKEMQQHKVAQMIKSAEEVQGSCTNLTAHSMEGRDADLGK